MIHHERNVSLGESIQAFAFRDESTNELMVSFSRTLLERSLRVAVEQAGAHDAFLVELDLRRIGELAAVVGKKDFEKLHEKLSAKSLIQRVEDRDHRSGIIVITNEREHALCLDEVDGEKDFAAFLTLYRVDLSDRDIRMLLKERLEILVSTADAAPLVHLDSTLFLPRSEPDLARQIDVLGGDGTIIDEAIDRSLAGHDQVLVIDIDMVRRVVFPDQRRDDGIKFGKLILRE